MWRKKKLVIIGVLVAAVLLVGGVAGVALAQTGSTDNTTPANTLLARVATILGIDQQKVEDAFTQAKKEMQDEALDNYLAKLVEQGKITQEQADQYKTWWSSRPEGLAGFGFRGHGGFRGMGGMRGLGGPCLQAE